MLEQLLNINAEQISMALDVVGVLLIATGVVGAPIITKLIMTKDQLLRVLDKTSVPNSEIAELAFNENLPIAEKLITKLSVMDTTKKLQPIVDFFNKFKSKI